MSKDRKIIYTQSVQNDPKNKQAESEIVGLFKAVEASAKAATKAIREANEAAGRVTARNNPSAAAGAAGAAARAPAERARNSAVDLLRKQDVALGKVMAKEEKYWSDREKAQAKAARQTEAALTKQDKLLGQVMASEERYWGTITAEAEKARAEQTAAAIKAAEEQTAAANKAAKDQAAALNKVTASQKNLIEGVKQSASGMTSLARAAVLFTAAGSKTVEQAVRMVAVFQATVDVGRGIIDMLGGARKAWQSYAAAAAAAAAAGKTASAAAIIGTGATAAAGVAAGATGLYAGEQIAMAGSSNAERRRFREFASRYSGFDTVRGWLGYDSVANSNANADRDAARARTDSFFARQLGIRDSMTQRYGRESQTQDIDFRQAALGGLPAAGDFAAQQVAAGQAKQAGIQAAINSGQSNAQTIHHEAMLAAQQTQAALERALDIDRQRLAIVQQAADAEKERSRAIQEQVRQSQISVAQLKPAELRTLEDNARRFLAGTETVEQRQGLRGVGLGEIVDPRDAAEGQRRLAAEAPNLAALIQKLAEDREKANKEIGVKVVQEVTGKIQLVPDLEAVAKQFKDIVKAQESQFLQTVRTEMEERFRNEDTNSRLRDATKG
jgi:hypothetical protein